MQSRGPILKYTTVQIFSQTMFITCAHMYPQMKRSMCMGRDGGLQYKQMLMNTACAVINKLKCFQNNAFAEWLFLF